MKPITPKSRCFQRPDSLKPFAFGHAIHTKVYIRPRNDVIYLRAGHEDPDEDPITGDFENDVARVLYNFARRLSNDERAKVQHLAIDTHGWSIEVAPEELSKQIFRFLGLNTFVVVLGGRRSGNLGDRALVPYTHATRKDKYQAEDALWSIFEHLIRLHPHWQSPKLEVVFWEGDPSQCSGRCGCDPKEELKIL